MKPNLQPRKSNVQQAVKVIGSTTLLLRFSIIGNDLFRNIKKGMYDTRMFMMMQKIYFRSSNTINTHNSFPDEND